MPWWGALVLQWQPGLLCSAVKEFRLSGDLLWQVKADGEEIEVWEPRQTEVVLGRCSRFAEEVKGEEVAADGVPVSHRRGGGCAVVVGPGVLVFSYRRRGRLPPVDWSAAASQPLVSALERLGVRGLVWREGGDVSLGDRKILGSCLYLAAELMVYGASLLVNPHLSLLERYLRHPPGSGLPPRWLSPGLRDQPVAAGLPPFDPRTRSKRWPPPPS